MDGIDKIRHLSPQASKITIKAVSTVTGDLDIVEMTLPIIETTTREMIVTSGRAESTRDEQIELDPAIKENGGFLDIHYAATLLPGLLSGLDFLASYPYGCLEQQLAAIMPQVYIKQLYDSIGLPYDLSKKMVSKYISKEEGYREVSLKEAIDEVLGSVGSFQRFDGGFGYWNDSNYSDLSLTLSVVSRLQDISQIGFTIPSDILSQSSKYIKNLFYINRRPYCTDNDNFCKYSSTERLSMIEGVLDSNQDDYEAYKMYQILLDDYKKENVGSNLASTDSVYQYGTHWSLSHAQLILRLA